MTTYLLIDNTNTITNTIDWDGIKPFTPPTGTTLVQFIGPSGIGWKWDGIKAIDPRPVPTSPPVPVTPSVPQIVSPRQARLALVQNGLLDQVNATINASDKTTQVWWEFASVIERQNPILIQVATNIGLQSYQIDALFVLAATL